ncbi:MAG: SET domain-containing protein-lysine N-methyltransferase [archaeon]
MKDAIIKNSKIHGKGTFANRDFKKGEVVIKYNLKELTKEEFENLPEKEKHYTSKEDGKYLLFLPPARFVNHSCEANTNPMNKSDVAIKGIKKGEEITTDYTKDNVPGLNMKCNCGSKNCKRVISNGN